MTHIGSTLHVPYILHATDEDYVPESPPGSASYPQFAPKHVRCLRTKAPPTAAGVYTSLQIGAKYATYNVWECSPLGNDSNLATQYEFYDFTNNVAPGSAPNLEELGNNTPSGTATVPAADCPGTGASGILFCNHMTALGAVSSDGVSTQTTSGLVGSELFAPLVGYGIQWVSGSPQISTTPLSSVKATAVSKYMNYQKGLSDACDTKT